MVGLHFETIRPPERRQLVKAIIAIVSAVLVIPSHGSSMPAVADMRALALVIFDNNSGTAFHVGRGCWVTAGHVLRATMANMFEDTVLVLHTGSTQRARIMARHPSEDLVLLRGPHVPYVLSLAPVAPGPGKGVWVIGFPGNSRVYGHVVPVQGTVHVNTGASGFLWIKGAVFYGHSGSPVLDDRRQLVGVAVEVHPLWFDVTLAVPVRAVREILQDC